MFRFNANILAMKQCVYVCIMLNKRYDEDEN